MAGTIQTEQSIVVGKVTVVQSRSPLSQFAVAFEDDGDTGYFYGVDTARKENQILDALHIYNADAVVDKDKPSLLQIVWSDDGLKAALLINGYPHAVFDFAARRGYCRSNFPPPDGTWTHFSHAWDDAAMELFT